MSLIARALGVEHRSAPAQPDGAGHAGFPVSSGWWGDGMVWNPGSTSSISDDQAMRVSAVFACMRLLTDAVSTLPLDTFTRADGVRRPYRPRPAYLDFLPPSERRVNVMTQVIMSLLTDGNAFVATPRDRLGVPVDLWVIDPRRVTVRRKDGRIVYRVQTDGGETEHDEFDIMHVPGLMLPGALRGLSPLGYAKATVGVGLSAQEFGGNFFANGAMPAAVIEHPKRLTDDQMKAFRDSWYANHSGGNQQRVGFLQEGAELKQVSVSPDVAQFLETRKFTVSDIARVFGVPPHLIADASNSTSWGSGLAEQNLAFGQFSLRPWVERIESGFDRLLATHASGEVFVKLNMDALLRASLKDRYTSYQVAIAAGFMAPNEARALEDLPPIEGGDRVARTEALAPAKKETA